MSDEKLVEKSRLMDQLYDDNDFTSEQKDVLAFLLEMEMSDKDECRGLSLATAIAKEMFLPKRIVCRTLDELEEMTIIYRIPNKGQKTIYGGALAALRKLYPDKPTQRRPHREKPKPTQQGDQNLTDVEMRDRTAKQTRDNKPLDQFVRFMGDKFNVSGRYKYFLVKHLTRAEVSPEALEAVQGFITEYAEDHPDEERFTINKICKLAKAADNIMQQVHEIIPPPPRRRRVRL